MPNQPIDIDHLTEEELRDLNHRVVARLRVIQSVRAHGQMLRFSIGDRVCFRDVRGGRIVRGVLIQYNRKSVSVLADDGARWTVSPSLLFAEAPHPEPEADPAVRVRTVMPVGKLLNAAGTVGGAAGG
jgi:hypothetical protein